jgi:hypothetical protein
MKSFFKKNSQHQCINTTSFFNKQNKKTRFDLSTHHWIWHLGKCGKLSRNCIPQIVKHNLAKLFQSFGVSATQLLSVGKTTSYDCAIKLRGKRRRSTVEGGSFHFLIHIVQTLAIRRIIWRASNLQRCCWVQLRVWWTIIKVKHPSMILRTVLNETGITKVSKRVGKHWLLVLSGICKKSVNDFHTRDGNLFFGFHQRRKPGEVLRVIELDWLRLERK